MVDATQWATARTAGYPTSTCFVPTSGFGTITIRVGGSTRHPGLPATPTRWAGTGGATKLACRSRANQRVTQGLVDKAHSAGKRTSYTSREGLTIPQKWLAISTNTEGNRGRKPVATETILF